MTNAAVATVAAAIAVVIMIRLATGRSAFTARVRFGGWATFRGANSRHLKLQLCWRRLGHQE